MASTSASTPAVASRWTSADSCRLYAVREWGKGYIGATRHGTLTVMPGKDPARRIDLYELVRGLGERGISTPVLLRFDDILRHRLTELRDAFNRAIADNGYRGTYRALYPIKVNQQRHVCEVIRDAAASMGFGFEVGSKPELLAVLGLTEDRNSMPIVCNGFKDDKYLETVVLAMKLGRNIVPVVERLGELEPLLKHAERYGVRPRVGLRIKPATRGAGRWESSGGPRSKFGLTASESLRALELLRDRGLADCLTLLHFHVGSQLSDIRQVKAAITELAHFYTELRRLGAGLTAIDLGGGLGVDYDGSHGGTGRRPADDRFSQVGLSAASSSINYTLDEYAADAVHRIQTACDDAGVPHPDIITESGRAMVAYASVLVVDVVGATVFASEPDVEPIRALAEADDETPQPVVDLLSTWDHLAELDPVEAYHDAVQARDEAMSLFSLGYLSLPLRAAVERLFLGICGRLMTDPRVAADVPEELAELSDMLSDIHYCNFSLFQSLPDWWAISHLFPVCPIHRLNERPTRRAVLVDMTCDSDGMIDRFAHPRGPKKTLEVHELRPGEPYYLAFFLTGAYQEVLGDLHNLFGDTHAVHVTLDAEGRWVLDELVEGDSVKEVLSYVQFDAEQLRRAVRRDVERAVRSGLLGVADGQALLRRYEQGLEGYTYLE